MGEIRPIVNVFNNIINLLNRVIGHLGVYEGVIDVDFIDAFGLSRGIGRASSDVLNGGHVLPRDIDFGGGEIDNRPRRRPARIGGGNGQCV